MLRQSLSTSATDEPTASCLDAETIAAWADGSLHGKNLETAEQHVAACRRCQAVAATVIWAGPERAVAEHPGWRGWKFRWLAPVTAVIVVGLWAALLRNERTIAPASIEESPQRSAAVAEPPQDRPLPQQTTPPQPAPQERASSSSRQRDEVNHEARLEKEAGARAAPAPAATPSAPSAAAAEAPGADQRTDATDRMQSARGSIARSMRESIAVSPEVVSPDGRTRWRFSIAGSVERSTDQGVTWETQSTGINAAMTAGSAPSPLVCWLVGRSGTVLLTTDGQTWQRVAFPESLDLVAVQATDARSAVITAADRRQFRTTNAGISWR
jgi:hypothetical protein